MNAASDTKVSVWDPLVCVGHWALVAAFAIAYLTGEEEGEPSDWHEWAGYIAGGIVVWRVLWGFAGPKYARFSDFAVWPRSALTYLIDLIAGRSRRYVGHSPAGGVMIIALLAFIGTTVITGIVADPVGNAPKDQASVTAATPIKTGEVRETGHTAKESFIGEVHGAVANITLALIALHILGVLLASFVHRENLVAAMITGKKRADGESE